MCSRGTGLDTGVLHCQIVLLVKNLVVSAPASACVKILAKDVRFLHKRHNLILFLHKLQRKATTCMPRK